MREIVKRETIGASIAMCIGGAVESFVHVYADATSQCQFAISHIPDGKMTPCAFYSPSSGASRQTGYDNPWYSACDCCSKHLWTALSDCKCSNWIPYHVQHMVMTLTKWCQTTRLETRTKESNVYASIWVANSNAE